MFVFISFLNCVLVLERHWLLCVKMEVWHWLKPLVIGIKFAYKFVTNCIETPILNAVRSIIKHNSENNLNQRFDECYDFGNKKINTCFTICRIGWAQMICMQNCSARLWHWIIASAQMIGAKCMLNTLYHDAKRLWTHCCHRLLSSFITIRYNFYGAHKSNETHLMWLRTWGGHCFDYQNTVLFAFLSPCVFLFCYVIFFPSWCDAVLQHMILSHLPWVHGTRKSRDAISLFDGRWYVLF